MFVVQFICDAVGEVIPTWKAVIYFIERLFLCSGRRYPFLFFHCFGVKFQDKIMVLYVWRRHPWLYEVISWLACFPTAPVLFV